MEQDPIAHLKERLLRYMHESKIGVYETGLRIGTSDRNIRNFIKKSKHTPHPKTYNIIKRHLDRYEDIEEDD